MTLRKALSIATAAGMAMALGTGTAAPAQAVGGTINGCAQGFTQAPLFAQLILFPPGRSSFVYKDGRTNVNGCYSFVSLPAGQYQVKVLGPCGNGVTRQTGDAQTGPGGIGFLPPALPMNGVATQNAFYRGWGNC